MRKLLPVVFLSLCHFISSSCAKSAGVIPCSPKPVEMVCEPSDGFNTCKADVTFVQEGSATHIYSCELRIAPQIFDALTVDVQVTQKTNFLLRTFKFNAEVQTGQSQVVVSFQRPIDQVSDAKFDGTVTVRGGTAK